MMALACAGPMPGSSSSAAASAVLRLTFADLAFGSVVPARLGLGLGSGGFTHVNLGANGVITRAGMPALARSSTLV